MAKIYSTKKNTCGQYLTSSYKIQRSTHRWFHYEKQPVTIAIINRKLVITITPISSLLFIVVKTFLKKRNATEISHKRISKALLIKTNVSPVRVALV